MLEVEGMLVQRGIGTQAHRVFLPNLSLNSGEIRAIIGESGCGKSTLLETVGLLLSPMNLSRYQLGNDHLDIKQLLASNNQKALSEVRSHRLGFVLQNGGLLPFLTVSENISLPRQLLGLTKRSLHVEKAIQVLRLEHLQNKYPQALSIGERQRVACVRAIAHEPLLLLADEPTGALDPHNARYLFELLLNLVAELGICALVVSHDWALVDDFKLSCLKAVSRQGETSFETTN